MHTKKIESEIKELNAFRAKFQRNLKNIEKEHQHREISDEEFEKHKKKLDLKIEKIKEKIRIKEHEFLKKE